MKLKQTILFAAGNSPALTYAGKALTERGILVLDRPDADVTHLLLPVPSFDDAGRIRGGGILEHILGKLPEDITVIGGNLDHPMLKTYRKMDLLRDPYYLAENAAITADCAMRIAGSKLKTVWKDCPVLILGWGRIGKFLTRHLQSLGADITVAARKSEDRALIRALGHRAEDPQRLHSGLFRYRLIFNTIPFPMLDAAQTASCRADCVLIDLASTLGMEGNAVIHARGLPGKDVPESAGALIAKTVIRLIAEKEVTA